MRDEFLSDEDLDLRNLTELELLAYWDLWLQQAQATNEFDADHYTHGVFINAARASHAPDLVAAVNSGESSRREKP